MNVVKIGNKFESKYDFRETCFGIVEIDNKFLLVNKKGQYSLVGGGIEHNETCEECLKREFLEEVGFRVIEIKDLVCVDCFWLAAGKYPLESLRMMVQICENTEQHTEKLAKNQIMDVDPEGINIETEED